MLNVTGNAFVNGALSGAASSALSQGVDMAAGLQKSFDWVGMAAAGVGSGVMAEVGPDIGLNASGNTDPQNYALATITGAAGAIANAATRSLINGTDFGDNIIRALPDTIGQTVGNEIGGQIEQAQQATPQATAQRLLSSIVKDRPVTDSDQNAANDLASAMDQASSNGPSQEQSAQLDAAINKFLATVATTGSEKSAVADYRNIVFGSSDSSDTPDPANTVVVNGDPNADTYFVSHSVDDAGIWAGKLQSGIDGSIGDFLNDHPGAGIALNVASIGLTVIGGPERYVAGQLWGFAKDSVSNLISGQYQHAGWDAPDANLGGSGMVWAGSLVLGSVSIAGGALGAVRNAKLAGSVHPKTGIPFDENGYPDFSSVAIKTVKINPTGSRAGDYGAANAAAGLENTPEGYTWHHNQEYGVMELVPTDIHEQTGHTGGFSIWGK